MEKFITAEQKAKIEEEAALEEERKLKEKGDNARDRALDMMMGGVLEIKKEDELKKVGLGLVSFIFPFCCMFVCLISVFVYLFVSLLVMHGTGCLT